MTQTQGVTYEWCCDHCGEWNPQGTLCRCGCNEESWLPTMPSRRPGKTLWVPINHHPGDQQYDDVPGTADESFWGQIGPEDTGWSWTIIACNDRGDQWDADSGRCSTEAEAKSAVESWRPKSWK